MIKLIKNGLLSVALLATVAANASKIVAAKTADSKVLNITLTEITKGEVLSIKDSNGILLYTESLQKGALYSKKFDFNTLPNGLYFLEDKENKKIKVTPILVNKDEASFLSNASETYEAPEIKIDGNNATLLIKNFEENLVKITISDKEGKEIFTESNDELLIYKGYDFSKLGEDTYFISVSKGDYSFTEKVKFNN